MSSWSARGKRSLSLKSPEEFINAGLNGSHSRGNSFHSGSYSSTAAKQHQQLNNSSLLQDQYHSGSKTLSGKKQNKPRDLTASFHPLSSLAEENLVSNFNKLNPRQRINSMSLQANQPQRIELPLFFNTPVRSNDASINKRIFASNTIQNSAYNVINELPSSVKPAGVANLNFSFNQLNQFRTLNKSPTVSKNSVESEEIQRQTNAEKHVYLRSLRRRKDYETLAFACKRAGKPRDEGRSYYSIGVLNDNIGKYREGIKSYERFLQICQNIGDQHGEALAYNCLGVDYQMLGTAEGNQEHFKLAIEYHKLHESIADINGKFLACINLGLCYDKIDGKKQALSYYQQALRHSVKMSNLASQTIAIGNIGRIGMAGLLENKEKMTVFIEKYLKLAQGMKDSDGELKAQMKMGQVTSLLGNFEVGRESFIRALEIAEEKQQGSTLQDAKCGFAVANAELQMQLHLKTYAQQLAQVQENQHNNLSFVSSDSNI